jgi:hypothetical protein
LPKVVPYFCWVQDLEKTQMEPALAQSQGPRDLLFACDGELRRELTRLGYNRVGRLPLAVDPGVYVPLPGGARPRDAVAFPANIVPLPEPEGLPGLYAWLTSWFEQNGITYFDFPRLREVIARALDDLRFSVSPPELDTLCLYCGAGLERQFHRLQTVRWLLSANVPVALYGRGWEKYPDCAPFAEGVVQPGPALARVYREHKAVLNVAARLNLHCRVLETMASGGLILIRSSPTDHDPGELADSYDLESEVAVFSTRDELLGLVDRAFSDDTWRSARIAAGRRRTLRDHTYTHRAKQVLAAVQEIVR